MSISIVIFSMVNDGTIVNSIGSYGISVSSLSLTLIVADCISKGS